MGTVSQAAAWTLFVSKPPNARPRGCQTNPLEAAGLKARPAEQSSLVQRREDLLRVTLDGSPLIAAEPAAGLVRHLVVEVGLQFAERDLTITVAITITVRRTLKAPKKVMHEQAVLGLSAKYEQPLKTACCAMVVVTFSCSHLGRSAIFCYRNERDHLLAQIRLQSED